jgi:filamentous hemagglutinin family protein
MKQGQKHRLSSYWLVPVWGLLGTLHVSAARAQVISDTTLDRENSRVVQDVMVRGQVADLIEGGATRGSNLFHSFAEFNVGESQRVYFANPTGVENILSRVTGSNGSDIMGTLGVDGGANLFFLNPNGIVFGPNAQLDISGSFLASTADSFAFADGSQFSATSPQAPELLSVNVPLGVQWGPGAAGPLTNDAYLSVPTEQSLTLIGGDITHTGSLEAPGGRVEVLGDAVSLVDTATIDVSGPTGGGSVLIGGDYQGQGTIPRATRTLIDPGATINADAITSGDGGTVIIWADDTTQFYGTVSARGGSEMGDGGFVEVSSPRALIFDGQVDTTAPNGRIGLLLIDPVNIRVVPDGTVVVGGEEVTNNFNLNFDDSPNEALIFASTINNATTGISLQATNNITFDAPINIVAENTSLRAEASNRIEVNFNIVVNGGDVTLIGSDISINNAKIGFLTEGSPDELRIIPGEITLYATGRTEGNSGNILLRSSLIATNTDNDSRNASSIGLDARGNIELSNSNVTASTNSRGNGGEVLINNSKGSLIVGNGSRISSSSGSSTSDETVSGGIDIQTNKLEVRSGGRIQTITFGVATGGSINISANEIDVAGEISASTLDNLASGRGGSIDLKANLITVNGGFVGAQSNQDSPGNAGEVVVYVNKLTIENSGRISAEAEGKGSAGSLEINVVGEVDINTGGRLTVSSQQEQAGNLTVNAGSVRLSDGLLEATSSSMVGGGESGSIALNITGVLLLLENGSTITAQALNNANGGNVNLTIPNGFIGAQPSGNNDILASAQFGEGGNITVFTNAIFGIEERNPTTEFTSDFNASSDFNDEGVIVLTTLGIDPSRGLAELPVDVIDVAGLVATGCVGDNRSGVEDQGEFSITGRGGLAPGPTEAIAPAGSPANLAILDDETLDDRPAALPPLDTAPLERLEEAQRLVKAADGRVTIVAQGMATPVTPASAAALNCNAL